MNTPELNASLQYIHAQLESLIPLDEANHMVLAVKTFTSSGSYPCSFDREAIIGLSYSDIISVVARLRPSSSKYPTTDALLVNRHVDSAWDVAGVSYDLVGVGIAMELVQTLASYNGTSDDPVLHRPVVFLFNGAEEPLLMGAHGFMSTHRWTRSLH